LAAGFAVETLMLIVSAVTYRHLLRRLGHDLACHTLLAVHLQRSAIGAISPVSGPTSVYVFLRLVKRRRVGTDDGLLTLALRSIAGQIAFVLLLVIALVAMGSGYLLPGLVAVVGIVAAAAVASRLRFVRAVGDAGWTERLPRWARGRVESFLRRARRHRLVPRDLTFPVTLAIVSRLGTFGILFASLHALNAPASPGVVLAAHFAAILACLAVPVFHGAGAAEAAATLALTRGGVPVEAAIGAVLIWRLLEFWLPIVLGLLLQLGAVLSSRRRSVLVPRPASRPPRRVPIGVPASARIRVG
jgi:uncharacterized membrane protein YbhN (UPF0104 family)